MKNIQLTNNFWLNEFLLEPERTPNQEELLNLHKLAQVLQFIRDIYVKAPIRITSGLRSYSATSQHKLGKAADFDIDSFTDAQMKALAEKIDGHNGGLHFYPSKKGMKRFIHIDIRPKRARWDG